MVLLKETALFFLVRPPLAMIFSVKLLSSVYTLLLLSCCSSWFEEACLALIPPGFLLLKPTCSSSPSPPPSAPGFLDRLLGEPLLLDVPRTDFPPALPGLPPLRLLENAENRPEGARCRACLLLCLASRFMQLSTSTLSSRNFTGITNSLMGL